MVNNLVFRWPKPLLFMVWGLMEFINWLNFKPWVFLMSSPSYLFEDEQKIHPQCFGHFVQKISPFLLNLNQPLNPNNYPNGTKIFQ